MEQKYPRISDENSRNYGYLDADYLVQHSKKIDSTELKRIIRSAIQNANRRSSRAILNIDNSFSEEEIKRIFSKKGKELFDYFVKYCGDPAATAIACVNNHFSDVAKEQFRNRTLQMERMNSGWRYQFIAKDCASCSGRFDIVSELAASEADFCVSIKTVDFPGCDAVNIYISVKNRVNTMGGQDWPKAIEALERIARNDRNRVNPYLCVFGIAMEKGDRTIRQSQNKSYYSHNTEIWKSDYFWPFFTNCSYEEIIREVLGVLLETGEKDSINSEIPDELIESFGESCRRNELLDETGRFHDPYRLVSLFVNSKQKK